ncbi:MAG: hypothetical protein C0592_05910 [Marinilabiliales bacterium]|nr:MAG: hypothetical protein C0592_05910 [Marinilabiliales bacterium]
MEKDLIIRKNSEFLSVNYDSKSDSWNFEFADRISFNVSAMWRLLIEKHIRFVSLDNGHQFGLPRPLDLVSDLNEILRGKSLLEIKVKQFTADLLLNLSDNIQIEIFISSSGYETYTFAIEDKNYIGMGAGDLLIHDNH